MRTFISSFLNIRLALVIVFALVQVVYYFKMRRKPNVTEIDKNLWQLRLFSGFFAALIFLAILYLPSTGFYHDIDPSPAAREIAFQDLVHNQARIGNQLDQLGQVLYIVFMMSAMYLVVVGSFIGRVWHDRQKRAAADDPAVKKPLGLNSD